jgi:hypothetical protein
MINNRGHTYICLSQGANNGLLVTCAFKHTFDDIADWNCPLCGQKLILEGTSDKTISELMQEGMRKEREENEKV